MAEKKDLKRMEHIITGAALCIVLFLVGAYAAGFTSHNGQAERLRKYLKEGRDMCNIPGISEEVREEYVKEQLGDIYLKDSDSTMVHLNAGSDWSKLSGGYRIGRIAKEHFRTVWMSGCEKECPWYMQDDKLFYRTENGYHYAAILPYGLCDSKQKETQIIVRKDNRKPIGSDLKENVEVIFEYNPETDTLQRFDDRCVLKK